MRPKFSIVMPSFNQGQYLEEAILSILNQDYPEKELIVIDGGSSDESVAIIRRYEKYLAYWVSEKDEGQSHAIEKGFARATGDWFNWINSDDALLPNALTNVAETILKHPKADLVAGGGVISDESGRVLRTSRAVPPRLWMPKYGLMGPLIQQGVFFSRRAYDAVGGINRRIFFRMDSDLYARILLAGWKGVSFHRLVGLFRQQSNAKTTLHSDTQRKELDEALRRVGLSVRWVGLLSLPSRIYRLLSGHYVIQYLDTRRMAGKSLQDLWSLAGVPLNDVTCEAVQAEGKKT